MAAGEKDWIDYVLAAEPPILHPDKSPLFTFAHSSSSSTCTASSHVPFLIFVAAISNSAGAT